MVGIRITPFGTVPKISNLVVDKDLDLRPYALTAANVSAPLDDSTWAVCEIPGLEEVAPSAVIFDAEFEWNYTTEGVTYTIPPSDETRPRKIRIDFGPGTAMRYNDGLKITYPDGTVEVIDYRTPIFREVIGYPGQTIEIHPVKNSVGSIYNGHFGYMKFVDTGMVHKTSFDLSGIWLSLKNDIGDIDPSNISITLQGLTMPLSDYAKYFPLAPSAINVDFTGAPSHGKMPVFRRYL